MRHSGSVVSDEPEFDCSASLGDSPPRWARGQISADIATRVAPLGLGCLRETPAGLRELAGTVHQGWVCFESSHWCLGEVDCLGTAVGRQPCRALSMQLNKPKLSTSSVFASRERVHHGREHSCAGLFPSGQRRGVILGNGPCLAFPAEDEG